MAAQEPYNPAITTYGSNSVEVFQNYNPLDIQSIDNELNRLINYRNQFRRNVEKIPPEQFRHILNNYQVNIRQLYATKGTCIARNIVNRIRIRFETTYDLTNPETRTVINDMIQKYIVNSFRNNLTTQEIMQNINHELMDNVEEILNQIGSRYKRPRVGNGLNQNRIGSINHLPLKYIPMKR